MKLQLFSHDTAENFAKKLKKEIMVGSVRLLDDPEFEAVEIEFLASEHEIPMFLLENDAYIVCDENRCPL